MRIGVARLLLTLGLSLITGVVAPAVRAHDFKPGLLALVERSDGTYAVSWHVPLEDARSALQPTFPADTTRSQVGARTREGNVWVERFVVQRPGGLAGQAVGLTGATSILTEVLVRVESRSGQVTTGKLSRDRPRFVIPTTPAGTAIARTYLRLGIEHIFTGLDHLAFVLLLVLLAPRVAAVLRAVTAFTLAHSLTLVLAALGLVQVPQAPVEATIALSIVLLANQLARQRQIRPATLPVAMPDPAGPAASRAPSVTLPAFGFGLLHGLGFAGALSAVGLPAGDIPLSLFCFNLGVEIGQLIFVAAVLLIRRAAVVLLAWRSAGPQRWFSLASALPARLAGAMGAYWLIDRVAGFFGP